MGTPRDPKQIAFKNTHGKVAIQVGQQINYGDVRVNQRDDDTQLLEQLPHSAEAAFNSFSKQHDPFCLPNTRRGVLNQVTAWINGPDKRCIFWLNGRAGTGKSTIARTVARASHNAGRLGASFFFSKGNGDAGHAGKFFTSIAVQLANRIPPLRGYICAAIAENRDIARQALQDQWRQLVLQPLSQLPMDFPQKPLTIVVDALDECEGDNDVRLIVQLFSEARSSKIPLRVLMTSRPEVSVRHGFHLIPAEHRNLILHNIMPSIVDGDITIFLEHTLENIRLEHGLTTGWPGEQAIKSLVEKASGLFIWAATACRFINDGKRFAIRRLSLILEGEASDIAPEKQLNDIYLKVLQASVGNYDEQERKEWHRLLAATLGAIVVVYSPLSDSGLGALLGISPDGIKQTLNGLHSILNISEDRSQPIRLHHPSFRDFLLDKERCGEPHFWVDEKQMHGILAANCIKLMSATLRKYICSFRSPDALKAAGESNQVEQCLPPELRYSCIYWFQHLQRSGVELKDDDNIHRFLDENLLHWLVALALSRETSVGIPTIISLDHDVRPDKCPSLYAFIHEANRFVIYYRSIIEEGPLQIYYSALDWAPKSVIRAQLERQIPTSLLQMGTGASDRVSLWDPVAKGVSSQTVQDHSDWVRGVVFSPDQRLIAFGSVDRMIRLWDWTTGTLLQTFKGHSGAVWAVTFSPDGRLTASASEDETVKFWDSNTGKLLRTLKGHSHWVWTVAFSPDGRVFASGSVDWTVRLWNPSTGALLRTFNGHSGVVWAVGFSPDGKIVISASEDKTIMLWDRETGQPMQTLRGHSDRVRAAIFSPDGKMVVSASEDRTVKLWDSATGKLLQTLNGHLGRVRSVTFSLDNISVASGSADRTIRLWDCRTGEALHTLKEHSNGVRAVSFSRDGKLVFSASEDKVIKVWDRSTGACLQTVDHCSPASKL
ncbi:hypothetical protein EMPG_12180 [Blastomyces silverae]|uniref:Nephrocystin 3-like N-terminal domain-containing protein n=1 Tax=Blastomyces silverae TaxID=2060906 RepID=A0A0H1BP11_9EURO|nr:hypothetical protein EMPG_12180 [Blastomyces silverae]